MPKGNPNPPNQWPKGVSGNPKGGGRVSLRQVLQERLQGKLPGGVRKVDAIADAVIAAAMKGDVRAYAEIRDTVDGRPAQTLHHEGGVQPITLVIDKDHDVP